MANSAEPVGLDLRADHSRVPQARPRRSWFWRILGMLFGAVLLVLLGGALWIAWGLPKIDFDRPPEGRAAITLEAADGTPITQSGGLYAGPVTRAELPDHLVQALLAIEDRRFYDHMGLDALGIVRALWRNVMAGGIVQGGSTLTQQLAKVLFLSPEQTLHRKLQEAAIATWLDTRYSKDEILTKYLDSVYFGAGATGITAAAKVYFDKPVAELNLAESAMLAGLVRAPSRLNPRSNLKAARERATLVLHAMVESDSISLDQALEAALNSAAPVRGLAVAQTGSWFGDWAYNEVKYAMGPLAGAARVRTTLQPKIQALAERVVAESLARGGAEGKIGQAALVALDLNGAVLAMVGGRSYAESQFNRATDAQRQPGSAFKTFVYMAALRAGWSPEDVIVDEPINIDGWKPKNYSGRYAGKVSLEQAFARSLNASTVKLAQEVGLDQVIATAHDLGIDATLEPNLTLSLGTAEVTLLDLTGAYASIAAGRAPVQPWGIAGLSTKAGTELSMFEGAERQTTPLEAREEMVKLLTAVVKEGTGKRAALEGFAAGKTGTSQESRDAWFIGFTDKLVVGVWVGNDDNAPMNDVTGGELPAEIWRDFTAAAMGVAPLPAAPDEPIVPEEPPVADDGGDSGTEFAETETDAGAEPEAELVSEEAGAEPEPAPSAEVAATEPEPAATETATEAREAGDGAQTDPVEDQAAVAPSAPPRAVDPAADESLLAERRAAAERIVAERRAQAERAAQPRQARPAVSQQVERERRRVEPEQRATRRRAEPEQRATRRRAEPEQRATRRPAEPEPRARRQAAEPEPRAARRRVEAEPRARRRQVERERRPTGDRPSILFGGRGLPGQ